MEPLRQPSQELGQEPEPIVVRAGTVALHGDLAVPEEALALVIFAHGSGSSRKSSRNRRVASALQRAGLGSLLMDLLSEAEETRETAGGMLRFDVALLAARLAAAAAWAGSDPRTRDLRIGYFGASTGAAAALIAAAEYGERVAAVVSRGGRPDLAGPAVLSRVQAPTLLLVGSRDTDVLELNREAFAHLRCEHELHVVPGASHLFEEPGALEQVAEQARDWFLRHLAGAAIA
jgi:putative phosphoribosyl transferase